MNICTDEKEIVDVSRLHTITNYAKIKSVAYNTVLTWIATRKVESTFISGMQFIITKGDE